MKVGIINVTGYAGMEIARILSTHPAVEITSVTGRSAVGKRLSDVLPHLWQLEIPITKSIDSSVDFVFSSLPSGASANTLKPLIGSGINIIDVSADFRFRDPRDFKLAYNLDHPAPEFLDKAVYGLPEIHRSLIRKTSLVANPGCYPEAAILALAPAAREKLIMDDIIVDAKSGISGAGRGGQSSNPMDHFAEANDNIVVYGLDGHGHQPEIKQEIAQLRGEPSTAVTFVPHRVPMTRGILATCYATLRDSMMNTKDVQEVYRDFYKKEPFVRITDVPPQTKQTTGSNWCLIYPTVHELTGRLIVISCLDNLVKGAAGQAVHNMNIMAGVPEEEGLKQPVLYP